MLQPQSDTPENHTSQTDTSLPDAAQPSTAHSGTAHSGTAQPGTEGGRRFARFPEARRKSAFQYKLESVVAGLIIVPLIPLFLGISLAIRSLSGPGVIFVQRRVGIDGTSFEMLKFRTMMRNASDKEQRLFNEAELRGELPDSVTEFKDLSDPRVTPIGRWLRRTSLDELPQLVNVLRGDMSLVGPRPALDWEVDLFSDSALIRNEVKPGLTGLWQVSGRSKMSALQMLELDEYYLKNRSFLLDLKILIRTPLSLIVSAA